MNFNWIKRERTKSLYGVLITGAINFHESRLIYSPSYVRFDHFFGEHTTWRWFDTNSQNFTCIKTEFWSFRAYVNVWSLTHFALFSSACMEAISKPQCNFKASWPHKDSLSSRYSVCKSMRKEWKKIHEQLKVYKFLSFHLHTCLRFRVLGELLFGLQLMPLNHARPLENEMKTFSKLKVEAAECSLIDKIDVFKLRT